eukprot:6904561-Alexandrium_andersonii.AAC.1
MLRDLASGQGIEVPYCILLSDAVAAAAPQENDADGPLAEAGAQWRWIRVRGPAGEPGLRRMR